MCICLCSVCGSESQCEGRAQQSHVRMPSGKSSRAAQPQLAKGGNFNSLSTGQGHLGQIISFKKSVKNWKYC